MINELDFLDFIFADVVEFIEENRSRPANAYHIIKLLLFGFWIGNGKKSTSSQLYVRYLWEVEIFRLRELGYGQDLWLKREDKDVIESAQSDYIGIRLQDMNLDIVIR